MKVQVNVSYSLSHDKNKPQNNYYRWCDVYSREEKDLITPVIIIVHGGAWIFGSKEDMREIATYLHEKTKFVCIAMNYTLSKLDQTLLQKTVVLELILTLILLILSSNTARHWRFIQALLCLACLFLIVHTIVSTLLTEETPCETHPAHVKDVAQCISWIYHHAELYNVDKNQIYLLGHSSGAHLVSLVTLNRRFLRDASVPYNCLKGVVAISGPYSFWRIQKSSVWRLLNKNVFNAQHSLTSQNFEQLPISCESTTFEHDDDINAKDKCETEWIQWMKTFDAWPNFHQHQIDEFTPPFMLMTAGIDLSLLEHAMELEHLLKQAGAFVVNLHFENTNHFSIRKKWWGKHKAVGENIVHFFQTLYNIHSSSSF